MLGEGHDRPGIGIARTESEVGMAEAGTQTRLLVVDDEQSIREMVRGFLEKDGMTVVEATDGPSAVEIAREAAPEVVVLDVMLPASTGSRFSAESGPSRIPMSSSSRHATRRWTESWA